MFKVFFTCLITCTASLGYGNPTCSGDFKKDECWSWSGWERHKMNFGMERVQLRFPNKPQTVQTSTLLSASSSDKSVVYTFSGYFPPIGNIVPSVFFNQILEGVSQAPYILISHNIYQIENGYWVMDYIMQDTSRYVYVKSRSIVTPFNAYTLQCIFPYGAREKYDYFLEHFRILCTCCD